jgi:hypothetical protein
MRLYPAFFVYFLNSRSAFAADGDPTATAAGEGGDPNRVIQ